MSTNVLERDQHEVKNRVHMPQASLNTPRRVLFRSIDDLRSRHRLGTDRRERILHAVAAAVGAGAVFASCMLRCCGSDQVDSDACRGRS
jgi:hypothetical protein